MVGGQRSLSGPLSHTGPERPVYSLANLYRVMMDLSVDTNIHVVLHNRVYVSFLGTEVGPRPLCCHLPN